MQVAAPFRRGLASVGLVLCLGAAAPAGPPALAVLNQIELGQWQLKELGGDSPPRTVCLSDPTTLIQLGHGGGQCQHFIIANQPDLATVHYTCPGTGHGRTTIKLATPRTFNLDTQGIVSGAPFEDHYEARRIGACTGAPAALR